MEYFMKRVLPVVAVGIIGGGYYGVQRFMKYLDHQACSRAVHVEKESKHRPKIT